MKSRRETLILILIVVGSLMLGSALTPLFTGSGKSDRQQGDPNDVTDQVPREALVSASALRRGPDSAKFTLVEFADYQCASCAKAEETLTDLLARRNDTAHIFRHYPLTSKHNNAERAAFAAEVARDMGKGWEMHDALFKRQSEWAESEDLLPRFTEIATSIGLDKGMFSGALDGSAEIRDRIQEDVRLAEACSVEITPSFFLITPNKIWAAVGPIGLERLVADDKYWQ